MANKNRLTNKLQFYWNYFIQKNFLILFSITFLSAIYIYLSVRYPIWNFDDISLNQVFKHGGWSEFKKIFLGLDIPTEYRTYSFSRIFQFILYNIFGDNPFPFYVVMAMTQLASSLFIYKLISRLRVSTAGINTEAFGCATIWLFSPFSICRTFHHFSYILLPFFLFLAYIYFFEKRMDNDNANSKLVWPSLALLIILSLSGESILMPIIAYLIIKIYQKRDANYAWMHLVILPTLLICHYFLLNYFNNYSSDNSRFNLAFTNLDELSSNLSYFAASIKSAFTQGLQLTAISYEPYYPLLKSYSFAWNNISQKFIYSSIFLIIIILLPVIPFRKFFNYRAGIKGGSEYTFAYFLHRFRNFHWSNERTRTSKIFVLIILLLSLWSLDIAMTLASVKLYGHQFALQIRYGYVVLPASLIVLFIVWRYLLNLARIGFLRATSWIIPCAVCVCWLAYQINVAPLNAEQDKNIIATLTNAAANGVRFISIEQKGFRENSSFDKYPDFGITNPFIRWGDSPFQQNWTVSEYSKRLGLILESRPYIEWNNENILFWGSGEQSSIVDKSQFMLIGSKSSGNEPENFPRNDLFAKIFQRGDMVSEKPTELLSGPARFDNGIELISLKETKTDSEHRLIFRWNGPESKDIVFVHFLDKNGKIVSQGDYAYEDAAKIYGDNELINRNELIYILSTQNNVWDRISSVEFGLYQISSPYQPQIFRKVINGSSDWKENRLLINI